LLLWLSPCISMPMSEIIQPHPCRHFETCGGCSVRDVAPEPYAAMKMGVVHDALRKAGLDPDMVGDIQGPFISPPGARRRAVMAAYCGHDKFVLGFNQARSNTIVDLEECPVLHPRLVGMIPALRAVVSSILTAGQGMDVAMLIADDAVDIVLRPWVRKKDSPFPPAFVLERLSAFAQEQDIARLSWQRNADDPTDLMPVAWRKDFTVDFHGTMVTPPPGSFLQATAEGEAILSAAVLDALPERKMKVLDLFAGCGTFTFALASRKGYKVHAVEGFGPAYEALKKAMPGRAVTAEKRDLAAEPLTAKELNGYDAIVLDPPRVGAMDQIKMIARSEVKQVVYVSCSAQSFARDAMMLVKAGFVLKKITVIDQFLWSPHVEMVGVFVRPRR